MAIKINVNFKTEDKGQVSQPVLKPVNPLWNKNVTPSPVIPRLNVPTSAPVVPRLTIPQATTNRIQTMKESSLEPQKPTLRMPFNYKDSQQGSRGTLTAEAQRIAMEQTPTPIAGTLGGIGSAFGIKNTPEQEQYLRDTKKGYGAYSVAGNIIGQIGGYGAVNAALKGTKLGATLVSTLGKKLGDKAGGYVASQGSQLLADAIVQAPMETLEAIQNDKSIAEDAKQILINRAIDLGLNMAIQGGSDAFKKMMANKKVMQAVVDAGIPESEVIRAIESNDTQAIRDIQNRVNIKGKEYEVKLGEGKGSIQLEKPKLKLEFEDTATGSYRGQTDGKFIAKKDGEIAGKVDYSIYGDKAHINFIETADKFKRQGVAEELVRKLQAENPTKTIDWGGTTESGTKLKESISTDVPNAPFVRKENRLNKYKEELGAIEKRAESGVVSEKDGDRWNFLQDAVNKIEPTLRTIDRTKNVLNPPATKRLELPKIQKANMDQAKPEYTLSQEIPTGKLTKGFDDAVKVEDGAKLKERGMSKNVRTDVNRPDALRENFDADKLFHETLANKTTLESAQARFDRGYDEALKDFDMTKTDLRADNVPLAKLIADEATKRGDMYTARRVVTDIAESLTAAGQFSQAAKILRASNDPATILMFVEKEIKKLNDQGLKRYGAEGKNLFGGKKGWSKIELTDDELGMIKKFTEEGTDEGKEKLFQDLFDSVSKRIPTTAREKFDSFRRMAMLFNPKTHIRNIAGNGLMAGMKKIADTIAVGGEKFIKPELRTKSIVIPKELKAKADDYFKANSKQLLEGSRWEVFGVKSAFAEKPIFKTGWLETLNDVSKNTLEAEDVFFFKKHFTNDLAGFMNARGLKEPTQEAIDYATKRAQEATFREANELANAINKLKGTKYGLIVEAAIPFTKTPANILSSGVKYSPIGLVQGAVQLMAKAPPAQAIETLSKGLTGTGLVALGAYMASQGLARGKYEKGKAEGLSEASGILPNSIQTPQGSYTVDWAQPSAIPFFMGVAMMEEAKKNKDANFGELMLKGLYAGGDTLVDQSMLKNVKELLGGGFGSAAEKITSLPIDYLKQAFPTVAGQVSRSIDPVKRERDYTNLATTTLTDLQSRTPVLSSKLPPKRDILGEEVKYGKVGIANTINQFLNPGTVGTKTSDPVVKELSRLYETQGSDFLPRQSVSKFKDKISYELTNKEKSEFQRIMGSYTKDKVSNLINTNGYKLMTDEKKAKAIASINNEGYDLAKKEIIKQRGN